MSSIFVLKKRPCVDLDHLAAAGFAILSALALAAQSCSVNLWLSCGNEGHDPTDPHTLGNALDVSVTGLGAETIRQLHTTLQNTLGPNFTVLYEVPTDPTDPLLAPIAYVNPQAPGPHLHLQLKKGLTDYPPLPA